MIIITHSKCPLHSCHKWGSCKEHYITCVCQFPESSQLNHFSLIMLFICYSYFPKRSSQLLWQIIESKALACMPIGIECLRPLSQGRTTLNMKHKVPFAAYHFYPKLLRLNVSIADVILAWGRITFFSGHKMILSGRLHGLVIRRGTIVYHYDTLKNIEVENSSQLPHILILVILELFISD